MKPATKMESAFSNSGDVTHCEVVSKGLYISPLEQMVVRSSAQCAEPVKNERTTVLCKRIVLKTLQDRPTISVDSDWAPDAHS